MYNVCVLKSAPNFDTSGSSTMMTENTIKNPSFNVEKTDKGTIVSILLPEKPMEEIAYLDRYQIRGRQMDIIGAFSPVIIASLKRRMQACKDKLFKGLATAATVADGMQILYKNGDRLEAFNLPTYKAMEDCINAMQNSTFGDVLENPTWIDQILKALLNDPAKFQTHEDCGGFAYSQLVSELCDLHANGTKY